MGNSLSSLLRAMMTRCSCYSRPWPVPLAKFGKLAGSSDDDTLLALVSLTGIAEAWTFHKINVQHVIGKHPRGADVIIVSDGSAFKLRNTP